MFFNLKFVYILTFITYSNANQKPKIIHQPSDIYGLLNQQISLRCDSSDVSDKISWIKDNSVHSYNINPLIIQLNHETEGLYQCNVSNSFGYTLSEKSLVKIAFLQNFTNLNNTKKYVSPSTTVLLQCSAPDGLPKPTIEWRSNLSLTNVRFKLDSNNNLRIDNIQRSDAGFYWCEANNLVITRRSSTIELIIFQKPVFQILPKHFQIMVASHILFPCVVSGDSPMFIQWYKLGAGKNDASLSRTILSTNCSMIINNVRLEDSGAYVCRAKNNGGITEIIYKLSVISFPSFTETPENIKSKVGESIFLRCSASGVPAPKVFWWHKNEYYLSDIDNNNVNNRITVFENGTLSISTVRFSDSGKYYCYAASFVGISRTEAILIVEAPLNMFPPVINKVPQNITTAVGSTVILTCQVLHSVSAIHWYKQSLKIIGDISTKSRLQILKNGNLQIVNAKIQDSAVYTCRALSQSLYSEKSASLTVKSYSDVNNEYLITKKDDRPRAPRNISVDFIGDTYVLIKWEFGAEEQQVMFRVEIAEQYTNNWVEVLVTRQKNGLINNLKPDMGYMISVRSISNNIIGDVAVYSEIIYTLDKPTIAADTSFAEFHKAFQEIEVYSVKLTTISSRQVQLTWKVKGSSILRSISGFIIKAERVSIKRCLLMTEKTTFPIFSCLENSYSVEDLINGYDDLLFTDQNKIQKSVVKRVISRERSRSSAIIGDLKPFRCYEIKIETFIDHIKGGRISGRDSKTKTVLTFDDLPNKAPKITNYQWVNNVTFYISWEAVDSRHSNGPITGYVIQIINMQKKSLQTYKIPVNVLKYTFKLESPELRYMLYLSADSCRGQGPRSWPVIIQYQDSHLFKSEHTLLQKPWIIASTASGISCGLFLTVTIIMIMICKKQRSSQQFPKHGQIPLVSSNKEMEDNVSKMAAIQHFSQMQSHKLLNNYETISPDFELTSSDLLSIDVDPHTSTTTVPRFNCSSEDPNSCLKFDENRNDSLAYASSSIIYKGCQHYNLNLMNKFPPSFYGPFIDIYNDPSSAHLLSSDSQILANPLIPPPPMYPPPPAPKNPNNFSDNNSEFMLSNQGSANNTHSSESTSACGSNSNKSNKTRKSRTPQSMNSSSSGSKKNTNRKPGKSNDLLNNKNSSSPSIGGDKKKDSLSNSTHSSQQTGAISFKNNIIVSPNGNKPGSRSDEQLTEIVPDTLSEQGMTSELSESDTAGFDIDENARDTDSVRVMYKLPMKRPSSPDYSTDSSYPYSMANHYSSVEPTFPSYPNNMPTKF